jgi:hypothetical protein
LLCFPHRSSANVSMCAPKCVCGSKEILHSPYCCKAIVTPFLHCKSLRKKWTCLYLCAGSFIQLRGISKTSVEHTRTHTHTHIHIHTHTHTHTQTCTGHSGDSDVQRAAAASGYRGCVYISCSGHAGAWVLCVHMRTHRCV